MKLLIIFIVLNLVNVIVQTVKSIVTIKCGKFSSALVNAVAFALYTVVLVYMNCDLSTITKALIVGGVNFIGVYIVKLIEEKARKDKLWKIEVTIPKEQKYEMLCACTSLDLSYNYLDLEKHMVVNFFCSTQKESETVKELLKNYDAKYFVSETKTL